MSYMKDLLEDVRAMVLHGASVEYIASCLDVPEHMVEGAIEILMDDPDFRDAGDFDEPHEPDYDLDSMDGDFDSGMASAGYGTDEDYGADFHDGEFI